MKGGFFTGRGKAKIIFVIETGMAKHTSIVFLKLDLRVTLTAVQKLLLQQTKTSTHLQTIDLCECKQKEGMPFSN